jgi:hypothetical protein
MGDPADGLPSGCKVAPQCAVGRLIYASHYDYLTSPDHCSILLAGMTETRQRALTGTAGGATVGAILGAIGGNAGWALSREPAQGSPVA